MCIVKLPLEILHEVVKFCIPEEIDQLSETCRTLYHATQRFRADHLLKRRQYTVFRYHNGMNDDDDDEEEEEEEEGKDDNDDHSDGGSSGNNSENHQLRISHCVELLLKIAQEPLIARYIQIADLRGDFEPYCRPDEEYHIAYDELVSRKTTIMELIEACPLLREAEADATTFWEHMVDEDTKTFSPSYVTLLILSFMTNVRKLALPMHMSKTSSAEDALFRKVADTMVRIAQTTNTKTGSRDIALAKLRTLLPMTGADYEDKVALQTLVPFMSIPSVVEVLGSSCVALDDGYTGYPFNPDYESFGRSLERLELMSSTVGPREIRTLLQQCSKLKVFKLDYTVKWHGCGWNWNAGHFMRAIEDTCRDTLEDLGIDIGGDVNDIGTGIVSMKRFRSLKRIELDVQVFLGVPCGGTIDQAWDYDTTDEAPTGDPEIPKVTDLLPASAEKLLLFAQDYDEHAKCLEALFAGVTQAEREKYLPNLKTVAVKVRTHSRLGLSSPADRASDSEEARASASKIRNKFEVATSAINRFGGRMSYVRHSNMVSFTPEIFSYL
ncbi:hypothetical protein DTO169E5_324 [Paecilomyces variotii]|nr:hypothetical protein DTO169E5_324 [Paecilomyces variotii]